MKLSTQQFYGSTTLGEKGQVVVPIEARAAMAIEKGQKLLVFGMDSDVIMLVKPEVMEHFAAQLAKRLDQVNRAVGQAEVVGERARARAID